MRIEDDVLRRDREEGGTYLVGVEQLPAAHELVDDEVILGVLSGDVLVEVEGGLEVDSLGLGDGRGAHFARVVVCWGCCECLGVSTTLRRRVLEEGWLVLRKRIVRGWND